MNLSLVSQRPRIVRLGLVLWSALVLLGCRGSTPPDTPPTAPETVSLRMLVIDDEPLAAAIREQWSTRGEGELQITTASTAQMQTEGARLTSVDAIIFPSGMLGEMVGRDYIVPFPDKLLQDANLDWRDVFDLLRLREATWGGRVMAIPFGSATPLFWYRQDLWKKHGLAAPATWNNLAQAVVKLREVEPELERVCVEPLAEGWRGKMLLARAAAYAQHRSYLSALFHPDDMRAQIAGPPYVRALVQIVQMPDAAASLELDPQQAVAQLATGKVAAAIGWWGVGDLPARPELTEVALARLPGAMQSYDRQRDGWDERESGATPVTLLGFSGRLAAVSRKARSERSAASLLVWLAGTEWSDRVLPASSATTLFRGRHRSAPQHWLPKGEAAGIWGPFYFDAVAEAFQTPTFLSGPRLPGEAEYLRALDDAVAKAVRGEAAPDAALREAADQWDAITDRIGRDAQAAAYRQSLGL